MEREAVHDSTLIASLGYDAMSRLLEIEFKDGSIYHYYAVPQQVKEELLRARDKDRFLSQNIRNKYNLYRVK